uniref:MSP domain-containing protein n=1 Tax=Physcomitrium patens TaxID=3218 RepID=A0A7I4CL69_PHYPA
MPTELLSIQPGELKFPFELKKQISSSLRLVNSTDDYVAFKVKTTSPKKYCVRPNTGVVQPHSSADVTVTMQAQREAPPDMQCKDKFLVQSVIAPSSKEVSQDMFNKEEGREVYEAKLKVLYVSPPQPPSPITESNEEEGNSPKAAAAVDNSDRHHLLSDPISKTESEWKFKLNEAALNLLTEERNSAVQQSRSLQQELQAYKSGNSKFGGGTLVDQKKQPGFSFLFVILVGLLGMLVGYLLGG